MRKRYGMLLFKRSEQGDFEKDMQQGGHSTGFCFSHNATLAIQALTVNSQGWRSAIRSMFKAVHLLIFTTESGQRVANVEQVVSRGPLEYLCG